MVKLHFNYKDVFRAARLGFSAKKIWMQIIGFVIGFLGFNLFAYLAHVSGGMSWTEVWEQFRLCPIYPIGFPWYSWIIWIIGFLWLICVILLTGTAIAKVSYEQLKGDEFFEIKEAFKFALSSGKAVILAPLLLVLFIILLLVMGLILSGLGWISYFGELFVMLMSIPAFFISLFIIYLGIVTIVSLLYGPAIVATTKSDTFDTLFESFSILNDQTWRVVIYTILLRLIIAVATFILGYFSAKAIFLGKGVLGIFMGDKIDILCNNAAHLVRITIPPICPDLAFQKLTWTLEKFGMMNLLFPPAYESVNWSSAIAGFGMGIFYYLIILFILSYGFTIWWAGTTLIFTVLVMKKDERNLLEEKEEVPPVIE
ncbi:MAG TPA: hypothetical protein EYP24_01390, partial [bacterium (Candidatus Stahlbacteria)]|nr:hypothetical protein [Candidatus Stahlbacteria bacterium]